MTKVSVLHHENYNGWEVSSDSLPLHVLSRIEEDLVDYSADYYNEECEYEGGVNFSKVKEIIANHVYDADVDMTCEDIDS